MPLLEHWRISLDVRLLLITIEFYLIGQTRQGSMSPLFCMIPNFKGYCNENQVCEQKVSAAQACLTQSPTRSGFGVLGKLLYWFRKSSFPCCPRKSAWTWICLNLIAIGSLHSNEFSWTLWLGTDLQKAQDGIDLNYVVFWKWCRLGFAISKPVWVCWTSVPLWL